jgi:hypothetical protein
LSEGSADGADADDRSRLDALDRGNEVPSPGVPVSVRLLEVEKVLTGVFQQTVDVEHVDFRLRFVKRHPQFHHCGTKKVGESDPA